MTVPQFEKMLESHKRIGKRLVPPLIEIGPWNEVDWVDQLLPELLWIGLLNAEYGIEAGAHLCAEVVAAAKPELEVLGQNAFLCRTSSFGKFSQDQLTRIREKLNSAHVLTDFQVAISPLCVAYPKCPLANLVRGTGTLESALAKIREVLPTLFNRWEEAATIVQVHATYMTFIQGLLFAVEGTSLENFPAVMAYPHTEESRKIASSCRSFVSMLLFNKLNEIETCWPGYFWNRGLELEKCRPVRVTGGA